MFVFWCGDAFAVVEFFCLFSVLIVLELLFCLFTCLLIFMVVFRGGSGGGLGGWRGLGGVGCTGWERVGRGGVHRLSAVLHKKSNGDPFQDCF